MQKSLSSIVRYHCETLFFHQVQHKTLERKTHSLSRRRDQIEKDYTRTLTLWHMEQERNKNHKDQAQQVNISKRTLIKKSDTKRIKIALRL